MNNFYEAFDSEDRQIEAYKALFNQFKQSNRLDVFFEYFYNADLD